MVLIGALIKYKSITDEKVLRHKISLIILSFTQKWIKPFQVDYILLRLLEYKLYPTLPYKDKNVN